MMYLVAEFVHMVTASFLIAILFLGGWHWWGLTGWEENVGWPIALVRIAVLLAKVLALILFFMLARWSWPRFRFDQLMDIAWKIMLPWGMVNVVVVAFWIEFGDRIAAAVGVANPVLMAGTGVVVLFLAWLIATRADPTAADNRPVVVSPGDGPRSAQGGPPP